MRITAEVSVLGTALPETALCGEHDTAANRAAYPAIFEMFDPGSGRREDCTDNTELECQVCGRARNSL